MLKMTLTISVLYALTSCGTGEQARISAIVHDGERASIDDNRVGALVRPGGQNHCTGFAVSFDTIKTAYHCVEDLNYKDLKFFVGGTTYNITEKVGEVEDFDEVTLRIDGSLSEWFELDMLNPAYPAKIISSNYPNGLLYDLGIDQQQVYEGVFLHKLNTVYGSSGSPIIQHDKVVAIHSAFVEAIGYNMAYPISSNYRETIKKFDRTKPILEARTDLEWQPREGGNNPDPRRGYHPSRPVRPDPPENRGGGDDDDDTHSVSTRNPRTNPAQVKELNAFIEQLNQSDFDEVKFRNRLNEYKTSNGVDRFEYQAEILGQCYGDLARRGYGLDLTQLQKDWKLEIAHKEIEITDEREVGNGGHFQLGGEIEIPTLGKLNGSIGGNLGEKTTRKVTSKGYVYYVRGKYPTNGLEIKWESGSKDIIGFMTKNGVMLYSDIDHLYIKYFGRFATADELYKHTEPDNSDKQIEESIKAELAAIITVVL